MPTSRTKEVKLLKQLIREMLTDPRPPTTNVEVGGSLASDEEDETLAALNAPRAACVLVRNPNGKILAVSRKDDPNDFGLPGGKVDPGEVEVEAAARELEEETGYTAVNLTKVFSQKDDAGYFVTTYSCSVMGNVDTDESGVVKWVDPAVLLQGSFSDYNRKLFKRVGIL